MLTLTVVNAAQLLMGGLVTMLNAAVVVAIASRHQLKTTTNFLFGNICFANLVAGLMLLVCNVMDTWNVVSLRKTESSLVALNSFVNIASALSILTNKLVIARRPHFRMSSISCCKIIAGIWAAVLLTLLMKALLFTLQGMRLHVCYPCFLVFELVTLIMFTVSTAALYVLAVYALTSRVRRSVHNETPTARASYVRELASVNTVGCLLLFYSFCFLFFILLTLAWLHNPSSVTIEASEVIICMFFLHCLSNPCILCIRDRGLRREVLRLLCWSGFSSHRQQPRNFLVRPRPLPEERLLRTPRIAFEQDALPVVAVTPPEPENNNETEEQPTASEESVTINNSRTTLCKSMAFENAHFQPDLVHVH